MTLHLRPVPGNIEYLPRHSGIIFDGEFYRAYPGEVKLVQLFMENMNKFVHINKIMKHCGIGRYSVPVYINRMRTFILDMGFSIMNNEEQGYKISMRVKQ